MSILDMQAAIKAAGWQWQEHVFNDGLAADCFIEFTKTTDPHVFGMHPRPDDSIGWGRFTQQSCWQQAYAYIILGDRG